MKKYELPSLRGEQGNAFAIMAYVRKAMEENNMKCRVKNYLEKATSSDYANLIGESYIVLDEINYRISKRESK